MYIVQPVEAFSIPGYIVVSPKIVTRPNVRVDFMLPKCDHHYITTSVKTTW